MVNPFIRIPSLLALILVSGAGVARAQAFEPGDSPLSSRLRPDVGMTLTSKALDKGPVFTLSPLFLSTDGTGLGKLAFGLGYAGSWIPLRASVSWSYVDPDGAGAIDQYAVSLLAKLRTFETWGISGSVAFQNSKPGATKRSANLVVERRLGGADSLASIGVDLGLVSSSTAAASTSDVVPRVYLAIDFERVSLGLDYTMDNDLAQEDDYSLELSTAVRSVVLGAGFGKHHTGFVYLVAKL